LTGGTPPVAVLAACWAGALLLAWPWLLGLVQRSWPGRLAGMPAMPMSSFPAVSRRAGRPRAATVAAYLTLLTALTILPVSDQWVGADLDGGILWLASLALSALVLGVGADPVRTAGALMALAAGMTPVILRAATLNLSDIAIAQQGGAGNWFLVRDPLLLACGVIQLLTAAALWPPVPRHPAGPQGLLALAVAAGLPLCLAHLFVVTYLGGWWAFATFLDGAPWLNTALKTVVVLVIVAGLRRRPALADPRNLEWRLPLAALVCAAAAAAWLGLSGAVW
jgi:hypothetical protein